MQFGFTYLSFFASLNNLLAVSARKRSVSETPVAPCVLQVEIPHSEMEKQSCEMSVFLAIKHNGLKSNTACSNGQSCSLTEEHLNIFMLKVWKGRKGIWLRNTKRGKKNQNKPQIPKANSIRNLFWKLGEKEKKYSKTQLQGFGINLPWKL